VRSEYMVHTTSFVFLNIINSSAPAIKKKLPLIRIGYYAKGETMVPPLSLPLKEQLGRHAIIILREYPGFSTRGRRVFWRDALDTTSRSRFMVRTLSTIP